MTNNLIEQHPEVKNHIRNQVELKKSKGPFWRWTLNYAVGRCPMKCIYCYNRRWDWAKQELRIKTDLSKLERQFQRFKWKPGPCPMYEGQWDIMFCSSHDPFLPTEVNMKAGNEYIMNPVSDRILYLAEQYPEVGDHIRILTKHGCMLDFGPPNALHGVTVTTLDREIYKVFEPNAWGPLVRFDYLEFCRREGFKTWVSSEPMLKGMNLVKAAESLVKVRGVLPVEWWVGHLNIRGDIPQVVRDAALSDEEIVKQILKAAERYPKIRWYLKHDVKADAGVFETLDIMRDKELHLSLIHYIDNTRERSTPYKTLDDFIKEEEE